MTATLMLIAGVGYAGPFFFSTGTVNNLMATASRPDTPGKFEIEAADDFVLTGSQTRLTSATFTGLLTGASPTIGEVRVEIYRVFPNDSNVGRTPQVPTRVNSPSDIALGERDSTVGGGLSFTTTLLSGAFTAVNSIQPGGIHPAPGQTTMGSGPVTGQEVQFNITLTDPLALPADHSFFIPQVQVGAVSFCGRRAPGRSCRPARRSRPICRAGRATHFSIPIGSASARTLSAPARSTAH